MYVVMSENLHGVKSCRDLVLCHSHLRVQLCLLRTLKSFVCQGCSDWGLILRVISHASVSRKDETHKIVIRKRSVVLGRLRVKVKSVAIKVSKTACLQH